MTLLDLADPLFNYICRLSRSARKGGNYDLSQVQAEIRSLFAESRGKAVGANLADQWQRIEHPLIFFCDSMIRESALPWAGEWRNMAFEFDELAGESKFFEMLEESLKDKTPTANDRLALYYTCMGLGFTGEYAGQPEYLRRKMKEIAARLQAAGRFNEIQRICPETYEKVDTRDLIEPPGTKLLGIGIALFGLVIVLFCMYAYLYHDSAARLQNALQKVEDRSNSAAQVATKEPPK